MGYMNHMEHLGKCLIYLLELGIKLVATEKYHGTSTSIKQEHNGPLLYHSGGEVKSIFEGLFDKDYLTNTLNSLMEKNSWKNITVYGETYGGPHLFPKQMSETYCKDHPSFIVFDIKVIDNKDEKGDKGHFLNFDETRLIANELKLDFVHYTECPWDVNIENKDKIIVWLEEQTTLPSSCKYNINNNPREGIVVRPVIESRIGPKVKRAICKNINEDFKEIKSNKAKKSLSINDSIKASKYDYFADTWATENRARHVLDEIRSNREDKKITIKDIKLFLEKIVEDIRAESDGYFEWPTDEKDNQELKRTLYQTSSKKFHITYKECN